MSNDNMVYLVIYQGVPSRTGYVTDIVGIYHNPQNAIDLVKLYADEVLAEYECDEKTAIKEVVWNGPAHNWPWLFTWEEKDYCQYTYKVVPYEYKD